MDRRSIHCTETVIKLLRVDGRIERRDSNLVIIIIIIIILIFIAN